jgi:probable selenate reductase FAD-binding subunit
MQIAQYTKAQSLTEAWELHQKRHSVILGGCCWLRLSPQRMIQHAIDLSALGLDTIEETDGEFRIGAMTSLRSLEVSAALECCTDGALKEALRHIVGVQFRNMATIGGSICGRFGFSDVITLLLALDADVVLYKGGRMKLEAFAATGAGTDVLTHVILSKAGRGTAYASLRLNATDFPIIACAVSGSAEAVRCAIGARPSRAVVLRAVRQDAAAQGPAKMARQWADAVSYGSNMRGSAEYRRDMAEVLCRRLLERVMGADVR